jgi:hypothetical protein
MESKNFQGRETTKEDVVAWGNRWKEVDKIINAERKKNWAEIPLSRTIQNLNGAFKSAIFLNKASQTSGLVEQQRYFHNIR